MKIVISGIGEMGSHLARMLSGSGSEITVIDSDAKALNELSSLADIITIEGDTTTFAVLRRAGEQTGELKITEKDEAALLKVLAKFPERVQSAIQDFEPSVITRYILDVAAAFNRFYHNCPILSAEDESVRATRVAITKAANTVLGNAFPLICLKTMEKI